MSLSTLKLALGVAAATALVTAVSVGCSGGDGASQPTQTPLPSATPTSVPTPTPTVRPVTRFDSGPGQVGIRFGGVQLTDQACDLSAAVSKDGATVVFVRGGPPTDSGCASVSGPVMIISTDGTGLREIAARGRNPSWSADGSSLVFELWYPGPGSGCSTTVMIVDVETGEQRVVASGNVTRLGNRPWSPDGRFVLLGVCEENQPGNLVQVFTVDGQLTRTIGTEFIEMGWSSDNQVVLRSRDAQGGTQKCLLASPEGDAIKPAPPETLLLNQGQFPWEMELSTLCP